MGAGARAGPVAGAGAGAFDSDRNTGFELQDL